MRIAVQSLMAAVVMTMATVQHDADAALYDAPPVVTASIDPLQLSIFYPYPSVLAGMTPPATAPKTAPFAFAPEIAMFAIAPEKLPRFDLPMAVPPAIAPETPSPQAYAAPPEPGPEAKPLEMAPEAAPRDAVGSAPPSELMPEAQPREIAPRKRSRASERQLRPNVVRIQFDAPTLAPLAHTRFCLKYRSDCRVHKIQFRGSAIDLTAERRRELIRVNADVNGAIRPMQVNETVAGEKWLISPKSGDCNDYAVTKRHELLARGWPSRSLLLAEVVTTWGEHHLVLVVRTRQGDLVADNLNADIRSWAKTSYQWVRVQSPANPMFWSTIKAPQPDVVAMVAQ